MDTRTLADWESFTQTLIFKHGDRNLYTIEQRLFVAWQLFTTFFEIMKRMERKIPPLNDENGNLIGFFRTDILQEIEDDLRRMNACDKPEFNTKSKKLRALTEMADARLAYYGEFLHELRAARQLNSILYKIIEEFLTEVKPKMETMLSIALIDQEVRLLKG